MKSLLSARLLALITVPVMISSLVLPTAAMAAAPTITSATITGTATAGEILTATPGGVTGGGTYSYTYQWMKTKDAITSTTGTNSDKYTISRSDAGYTITVKITVRNGTNPAAVKTSDPTAPVTAAPSIASARISGTEQVGQVLSASAMGVGGYPTTLSYEWKADEDIVGTNDPTYTVGVSDHGKVITVKITVTNSINSASAISDQTFEVVGNPGIVSASFTGTAQVGQTLTAVATGVTGGPLNPIEYRWAVRGLLDPTDPVSSVEYDRGYNETYTVESGFTGWEIYVEIGVSTGSDAGEVPNRRDANASSSTQIITASSNADLSGLTASSGALTPTFASGTLGYTAASVSNATSSITVTPTKSEANASIEVRVNSGSYASVTSGSASGSLTLNVGSNRIDVKVTAEDGTTTKTYTVTVTRATASAPQINVIFNANNGTGGWKNQFITAGKATSLLSNTYTRTGYTPNGWNTQADGNGTPYTNGQSVTLALNSGLTLFAKWTANPNTVTFNANGDGTSGIMNNQSISSGAATALTANSFTRTGYTFAGWATNSNGSGTTYRNGQSVTLTSGLNLFARWSAKTNTVFFNSNNGAGNRISQDIISDRATALRANSFTRTGYTFAGWASDSALNAPFYANNAPVTITSGLNLFARWNKN